MTFRVRGWLLVGAMLASCSAGRSSVPPTAKGGVIDLRQWDFTTQGPVALRGEWLFRYGELLGPSALKAGEPPSPPMITVPGLWNGARDSRQLPGLGAASHALRILLPPRVEKLGLAFGEAHSAERVWLNGRPAFSRGEVSLKPEGEIADVEGRIVAFPETGPVLDLVLEISNHLHFEGGPVHAPALGLAGQLHKQADEDANIDYFLLGGLVMTGLFYAALSLTRPDRPIQLFAGMTLLLALRTATVQWHITVLWPMDPDTQLRVDYLTFLLLPPVFCALVRALFPEDVPRWVTRATSAFAAVSLVGVLALPTHVFTAARDANIIVPFLFTTAALLWVARAGWRGRKGTRLLLASCVFVMAVVVHDIALKWRLLPGGRELLPVGTTVLVFAHAVVLGRRLSDALHHSERMSSSLHEMNTQLEERIARRTQELERVAMTDPLTGLWNRRQLTRLAEAERSRAVRSGQLLGVMMIDCDDFKSVNDAHGHETGDHVLEALSRRFESLMRSHDLLGRWGGEEFVIVFSTADREGAFKASERLRCGTAESAFQTPGGISRHLTVSVGAALLATPAESFESLLRRADRALYVAKTTGKNRVVFADEPAGSPAS